METPKKSTKAKKTPPPVAASEPAKPPAVLTEREKRAARLPVVQPGNKLVINEEQRDYLYDLVKADHPMGFSLIMASAALGLKGEAEDNMNNALTQVDELKPQSYLESMLIAQMIQVNNAAGKCTHLAMTGDTHFKERNANLATKFQRTFLAQIEALQKLRGKGGQKVTVEHVTVNAGGQAIVGNVNHGAGREGGGQNGN